MKSLSIIMLAGLLTGCSTSSAQISPAAAGTEPALWTATYVCGDGQRVDLKHDRAAGLMLATRSGESFTLQEEVGKNPPQFVMGSDVVVVETGGIRMVRGKAARQACIVLPDTPVSGTIWGTLAKLDRMALPPGSRAKILLVNAARADAPAVEIASTTLVTAGNQVPLHFLLSYPPAAVSPRGMTYRLQARIEAPDGQLMFLSDTATFVLEGAAPQPPVELLLVRTAGG